MPDENKGAEEAAQISPGVETDEQIMQELGDIVSEAKDLSRDLYSEAVKLYGLLEMFAGDYLAGKNVDHYAALIHNAFADHDNTKATLDDVLDSLWEALEERGVVHTPAAGAPGGDGGDGTGDGTGEGTAGQAPGDDV